MPRADLLWPRHGGDNSIDIEFLNYISFVIELREWRRGDSEARRRPLIARAASCFATRNPTAVENLDLLFDAFDAWVGEDIDAFFGGYFSTTRDVDDAGVAKLVIFGTEANPNLFEACIRDFGNEQRFGTQRKLLLYAVLLHRIHATTDFPQRLRVLRNLLAASEDELRPEAMSQIVLDVEHLVLHGDLDSVVRLNQAQRGDEIEKRSFLIQHPDMGTHIFALEDHDLLRGSLVTFELYADRLEDRAVVFDEVFADALHAPMLTGTLLALGQYQRKVGASMKFGAPVPSSRWRDLLTGADRDKMAFDQDCSHDASGSPEWPWTNTCHPAPALREDWLRKREDKQRFDWRY